MNFEHCLRVKDDLWFFNTEENDTSILYSVKHDRSLKVCMRYHAIVNKMFKAPGRLDFENIIVNCRNQGVGYTMFIINIASFKIVKKFKASYIFLNRAKITSVLHKKYEKDFQNETYNILNKLGKFLYLSSTTEIVVLDYKFNIVLINGKKSYKCPKEFSISIHDFDNFTLSVTIIKNNDYKMLQFTLKNGELVNDDYNPPIYRDHNISVKKLTTGYFIEQKNHSSDNIQKQPGISNCYACL